MKIDQAKEIAGLLGMVLAAIALFTVGLVLVLGFYGALIGGLIGAAVLAFRTVTGI